MVELSVTDVMFSALSFTIETPFVVLVAAKFVTLVFSAEILPIPAVAVAIKFVAWIFPFKPFWFIVPPVVLIRTRSEALTVPDTVTLLFASMSTTEGPSTLLELAVMVPRSTAPVALRYTLL